jgi:aspartate racemase
MKTIGIIGGSTDVSTAEYYKLINAGIRQRLGGVHTGEIIINSMDFAQSLRLIDGGLWEEGGKYLNGKALSLERAGADFILCACNFWHKVADSFMKDVKIPLLHIMDPTGGAIQAAHLTQVGLLGTKATMSSGDILGEYKKRFNIDIIVPSDEEQDQVHHIILTELSQAQFTEKSKAIYLEVMKSLRSRGAQGIILGCTEIPLLVNQTDLPELPMFDTLKLHVEAAVSMALSD